MTSEHPAGLLRALVAAALTLSGWANEPETVEMLLRDALNVLDETDDGLAS